ncbi:MAG: six-hairpin glycosidase, partial [Chlorobi bacterium]|nr:six-hairpin glycosidase [Chlorobiota bacterium]
MKQQIIEIASKSLIFLFILLNYVGAQTMPASIEESASEPVVYVGDRVPDAHYYDGKLPHAVGVHHYQIYRANRAKPLDGDKLGWTYNHQPFLAYWNGKFYVQYLSDLFQEHTPPGKTLIVTSKDGRYWNEPVVAFPEYTLPEINYKGLHVDAGTKSVMHQRMGF